MKRLWHNSLYMVMKFQVEQKGTQFMVVNETTGDVRGRYRTEGEAQVACKEMQRIHNEGVAQINATSPVRPDNG